MGYHANIIEISYKHKDHIVNNKTGVGLEIRLCVQTSTVWLTHFFFRSQDSSHIWLTLEAYGNAFPSLSYPWDLFLSLSGTLFLSTMTVMQTRIVLGRWDADKFHSSSSVSLPACPCLEQLDTLNSGAYQKLHVSSAITADTIVTRALSYRYIQWTHEPSGPLWLICLPPRGEKKISILWSLDF